LESLGLQLSIQSDRNAGAISGCATAATNTHCIRLNANGGGHGIATIATAATDAVY
jgi:hypothetical protein